MPAYCHQQDAILRFMQLVYAAKEEEKRKLKFLYTHSGIKQRYSVIPDYSLHASDWVFYPDTENLEPFPSLEKRMEFYNKYAPQLSADAINNCIKGHVDVAEVTHLITVTCTGLSAPGLDIQLMELLGLQKNIFRTSVNFMGCYAALHALKLADTICKNEEDAKVLLVCTELCTLHFQREATMDNIASSLLFGDGAAAVLIGSDRAADDGLFLKGFYSEIIPKGRQDMAWELSSTGFLMTLSGYIPDLIEEDFSSITERSLNKIGLQRNDITSWCIHPGGKRILQSIEKSLHLQPGSLLPSYRVLQQFGNMSSATILFVLKEIMDSGVKNKNIFGAAFGPGLTIETLVASS